MLHAHINACIAAGGLEDVHTEQRMPPAAQLAYLTILALKPPAELAQLAAVARKDAAEQQAREAEKQAGEEEKERMRLLYKVVQGVVTLLSLGAVWLQNMDGSSSGSFPWGRDTIAGAARRLVGCRQPPHRLCTPGCGYNCCMG